MRQRRQHASRFWRADGWRRRARLFFNRYGAPLGQPAAGRTAVALQTAASNKTAVQLLMLMLLLLLLLLLMLLLLLLVLVLLLLMPPPPPPPPPPPLQVLAASW
eukprot:NODE_12858_length_1199_cov_7.597948.p5 GENE.NODE_12858_length_1199_cov_7.597948~~NODE_12858_length_1199_cov_7.597948.p5  ORF type:complete len:104 (+),score=31.74 NODE_12858_length_1199_cov_7.597948:871-1182(+)